MPDSKNILNIGDKAPNFKARIQYPLKPNSKIEDSQEEIDFYNFLKGDNKKATPTKVLLVFYPGDDTPGCTTQLCAIRDIYKEYQEMGVTVLGVNQGTGESHSKFIEKYNYQFGIIIDEDKSIRQKFRAERKFFKNTITKRGVFLVDQDAKILFIHWGQQNNQQILDMLKKESH